MQGRGRRGSLGGSDPFAGFGAFGGFGGHQSFMPDFFGGRDPFDDPFFTQPLGSMFQSSFFGPSGRPFPGAPHAGFIEQQAPQPPKRRGPVIEELNSDDEEGEDGGSSKTRDNSRKQSRLQKEPYVEIPDDEADDRRNKHIQSRAEVGNRMNHAQSQSPAQFYSFQTSSVSYGGADGACYTKSLTRRAGSDGVAFEELKEADSTSGQANHRISRGLHNKGHTLSRKLNSDGKVDTAHMLHNLNEDELDRFEQAWDGSSGRHFTNFKQRLDGANFEPGSRSGGGWALPSTQQPGHPVSNSSRTANGIHAAQMQRAVRKAAAGDRGSRGRAMG